MRIVASGTSSTNSGYIPSSVYLRSSYRTKQYPTLSTIAPSGNTTRTLSVVGAGQAHADVGLPLNPVEITLAGARDRSATLPSPYRNKYEVPNVQIDSPVGLYNCPQQRTSQAFSSMDDLDALATNHHHPVHHLHPNYPPQPMNSVMSSPTTSSPHRQPQQSRGPSQSYVNHHLMNHRHILHQAQAVISHVDAACSAAIISQQPSTTSLSFKANSLERSSSNAASVTSRQKKFVSNMSNSAATRELPALPVSSINIDNTASTNKMTEAGSRSMEDLDALESLGVHGRSKMHYREIINESNTSTLTNGTVVDGLSASRVSSSSCSGMPSSSHSHNLPNTDEYPTHHSSSCNSSGIATTITPSISHRSSVSSIASATNVHGHVGVPRGYAAMSAAAQAVLDQPHQHHSHPQQPHQHSHHHRDAGGPYPALSHRNSTLLPGQTYPEPSLAKSHHAMGTLQEVFYHREMRLAAAVAANLSPPISSTDQNIHHSRVSLSSNNSSSQRKDIVHSAPLPPPKQNSYQHKMSNHGGHANIKEESPPPLFPKQYHQVVEQRRRSGLDRPTATAVPPKPTPPVASGDSERDQSPAIDRKSKPSTTSNNCTNSNVPTASSVENSQSQTSTSTLTNSVATENSVTSLSSLDTTLVSQHSSSSDCANNNVQGTQGLQPKYVPYKETTKPFEMSDFYKYSTKFRKTSASSLPQSDSSGGADESSPRSSTASENSPPELPLRPNAISSGKPNLLNIGAPQEIENRNSKTQIPPPPPPKTALDVKRSSMSSNSSGSTLAATVVNTNTNDNNSLADAFSSEMLDWYNTQSNSSRSRGASIMKTMSNNSIKTKGTQSGPMETKNTKDSTSNKPATLV